MPSLTTSATPSRRPEGAVRAALAIPIAVLFSALVALPAMAGEHPAPAAPAPAPTSVAAPSGPAEVGQTAPAFNLPAVSGERFATADHAGHPLVVVFFRGGW